VLSVTIIASWNVQHWDLTTFTPLPTPSRPTTMVTLKYSRRHDHCGMESLQLSGRENNLHDCYPPAGRAGTLQLYAWTTWQCCSPVLSQRTGFVAHEAPGELRHTQTFAETPPQNEATPCKARKLRSPLPQHSQSPRNDGTRMFDMTDAPFRIQPSNYSKLTGPYAE
jgi:hypothetical protein